MKFGVYTMNAHSCSGPDTEAAVAQAAESAGFESLWCGEHVVMVEPAVGSEPLGPRDPITDPMVALAYLAGVTTTIRLATGVVILPLRNPLVLAKQLASLDVVSKGRLTFGFGVGWLEPEFDALGVPFRNRGARADEYLQAMISLWTQDEPAFAGEFVQFQGVQCRPQPVQKPYPAISVGGRTDAAMRRALRSAHDWFPGLLFSDADLIAAIGRLNDLSAEVERPAHLGRLEITASVKNRLTPDRVAHLESIGVDRLILLPRPGVRDDGLVDWIHESAKDLGLPTP